MSSSFLRRRFRLQFSLQALLAMMLLASVALVVYRWPWVVEGSEEFANVRSEPVYSGFWPGDEKSADGRWLSVWKDYRIAVNAPGYDEFRHQFRTQATYRRGWNGRLQLHGLKTYTYVHNNNT